MIKRFLESLKNSKGRILGPITWIMTWIGLLPEMKSIKVAFVLLHELETLCVILEYVEIGVVRTELRQVIETVKTSFLTVIQSNAFLFGQNRWKQVVDYITEAYEYERVHHDKIRGNIDRLRKYWRRVTYILSVLAFATYVTRLVSIPLLKFVSSQNLQEGLHNGTDLFLHVLSFGMPIDKKQSPGFGITVICNSGITSYDGSLNAGYDIIIKTVFGEKLDFLKDQAKLMLGTLGNRTRDDKAGKTMPHLHHEYVLPVT